jgi:hypothetical protein
MAQPLIAAAAIDVDRMWPNPDRPVADAAGAVACGAQAPGQATSLDSWAILGAGGLALRQTSPCSAE